MIVAIPEVLREVLGSEGAGALAELLNRVGHEMRDHVIAITEERFQRHLADELDGVRRQMGALETGLREEISGLREEMTRLESGLREDMTRLESGLREGMAGRDASLRGEMGRLETRLSDRMNRLETRLLRWSFGFWVTQFGALLLFFYALFQHLGP